jgi:hypothetical protein
MNISPPSSWSKNKLRKKAVKQGTSIGLRFNRVHSVIFQKIELYITTAVRPSNLA